MSRLPRRLRAAGAAPRRRPACESIAGRPDAAAPACPRTRDSAGASQPRCTLVGAGPSDPELLTLKALRAIRAATCCLSTTWCSTPCSAWPAAARASCMSASAAAGFSTDQSLIERLMMVEALKGERVVRLKGGDPFAFGRAASRPRRCARTASRSKSSTASPRAGRRHRARRSAHPPRPCARRHFVTGHPRRGGAAARLGARSARPPRRGSRSSSTWAWRRPSRCSRACCALCRRRPRWRWCSTPPARRALLPGHAGHARRDDRARAAGSPAIIVVGDVLRGAAALRARPLERRARRCAAAAARGRKNRGAPRHRRVPRPARRRRAGAAGAAAGDGRPPPDPSSPCRRAPPRRQRRSQPPPSRDGRPACAARLNACSATTPSSSAPVRPACTAPPSPDGAACACCSSTMRPRWPRRSASRAAAAATSPTAPPGRPTSCRTTPPSAARRWPATRRPTSSRCSPGTASPGTRSTAGSCSATAPARRSSTCCWPSARAAA